MSDISIDNVETNLDQAMKQMKEKSTSFWHLESTALFENVVGRLNQELMTIDDSDFTIFGSPALFFNALSMLLKDDFDHLEASKSIWDNMIVSNREEMINYLNAGEDWYCCWSKNDPTNHTTVVFKAKLSGWKLEDTASFEDFVDRIEKEIMLTDCSSVALSSFYLVSAMHTLAPGSVPLSALKKVWNDLGTDKQQRVITALNKNTPWF